MAKIYFNRLLSNTIAFNQIPSQYKSQVRTLGEEWLQKGKITEEQFSQLFIEG